MANVGWITTSSSMAWFLKGPTGDFGDAMLLRMCFIPKKIVSISFPGSHISIYFWLKPTFIYCIYLYIFWGLLSTSYVIKLWSESNTRWKIVNPQLEGNCLDGRLFPKGGPYMTLLVDHGVCCPRCCPRSQAGQKTWKKLIQLVFVESWRKDTKDLPKAFQVPLRSSTYTFSIPSGNLYHGHGTWPF